MRYSGDVVFLNLTNLEYSQEKSGDLTILWAMNLAPLPSIILAIAEQRSLNAVLATIIESVAGSLA